MQKDVKLSTLLLVAPCLALAPPKKTISTKVAAKAISKQLGVAAFTAATLFGFDAEAVRLGLKG